MFNTHVVCVVFLSKKLTMFTKLQCSIVVNHWSNLYSMAKKLLKYESLTSNE